FRCPFLLFLSRRHGEQPIRRQRTGPLLLRLLRSGLRLLLSAAAIPLFRRAIFVLTTCSLPRRDPADQRLNVDETPGRGFPPARSTPSTALSPTRRPT